MGRNEIDLFGIDHVRESKVHSGMKWNLTNMYSRKLYVSVLYEAHYFLCQIETLSQ